MHPTDDQQGWQALVVELPAAAEEELLAELAPGSLGARVRPRDAAGVELTLYFDSAVTAQAAAGLAREGLARRGLPGGPRRVRVEAVADDRWVERYQSGLAPLPLGRFVVVPDGCAVEAGDDRDRIRLTPGRAFGTGEHATTRMCAARLEALVRRGTRWIDLGCGSAILSVVLARCGAGEVLGLDVDPDALQVARKVVGANGLTGEIDLRVGSLDAVPPGTWDGVVANIASSFFLRHAEDLGARLAPGGLLVAAGFLAEDEPELLACLGAAGLVLRERGDEGPWRVLVLERR